MCGVHLHTCVCVYVSVYVKGCISVCTIERLRVYTLSLGGEKCTGNGEHSASSTQQTGTVAVNQLNTDNSHPIHRGPVLIKQSFCDTSYNGDNGWET